MTAARKRVAVAKLADKHPGSSQRLRCRVVGLARFSARYRPRRAAADAGVLAELQDLARKHPRYGYRRTAAPPHRRTAATATAAPPHRRTAAPPRCCGCGDGA